jgi:uncharacterized protein YciI
MKHFVLEGEYLVPFEELADLIPRHREFLKKGYDAGFFLCSGPQIPARGGFLVARAESREKLDALLADEPFTKTKNLSPRRRRCTSSASPSSTRCSTSRC